MKNDIKQRSLTGHTKATVLKVATGATRRAAGGVERVLTKHRPGAMDAGINAARG